MADHNEDDDCLSPKEIHAAAGALCRWFGSQDIHPASAIPIMVDVMTRIVRKFPESTQKEAIDHIVACFKEIAEG